MTLAERERSSVRAKKIWHPGSDPAVEDCLFKKCFDLLDDMSTFVIWSTRYMLELLLQCQVIQTTKIAGFCNQIS